MKSAEPTFFNPTVLIGIRAGDVGWFSIIKELAAASSGRMIKLPLLTLLCERNVFPSVVDLAYTIHPFG